MNDARTALVVGINSCAGSHLADALLEQGMQVVGTHRPNADLAHVAALRERVTLIEHEIDGGNSLASALSELAPFEIYLLASAPRAADARVIAEVNVAGATALLEDVRLCGLGARVVVVSSSAVYGLTAAAQPLDEEQPLRPAGRYGLGKVLLEQVAQFYAREHGLHVTVARPFNHPGPREAAGLILTDYARRMVAAEHGQGSSAIRVRSPDTVRDFVDVRDAVAGYCLLARQGRAGTVYNFCSGVVRTVGEVVRELAARCRKPLSLEYEANAVGGHQLEGGHQLGSAAKAQRELGWQPAIPWKQTLDDVMTYVRGMAEA